jgi:hypothetical protein
MLKQYFFIPALLEIIERPDFFNRVCAWAVRAFAVLFALGAVIGWFQMWKAVFEMNGAGILGGVIFQLFFVLGVYMVLHILWIRSGHIETLGKSEFVVLPIVPIFLKLCGEVYASIALSAGFGKGVLHLFVNQSRLADRTSSTIPGVGWEHSFLVKLFGGSDGISSFINAILYALGGVISSVLWLVVFYLAAEFVTLLLGVARDMYKR